MASRICVNLTTLATGTRDMHGGDQRQVILIQGCLENPSLGAY